MDLPRNRFKQRLTGDAAQFGCWAGFGNAYATEVLATTDFDWLLIDGEHAPNTVPSVLAQLQAVAPYTPAPVVRLVDHDPALIKQVLDIGAQSLMIPMVNTAADAESLVRAMQYPPRGSRGIGGGLTRATRWGNVDDYLSRAHEELCLIVQVESRQALDNLSAIAAVDGVDALFIGPYDLSAGLGHPGNPGHPEVQAAIDDAIRTIQMIGKRVGVLATDPDDARRYHGMGCDFIAAGIDILLLKQAAAEVLASCRAPE
ncbi:HpcH/HpaI aldolase family protein [Aidingimonas halophila]|uniref:2,4-dihydroxyhept-2-enedioate aldolase n=1 Tax=Aidingimonas halophila TaxID=574349 RepID=A0A1H2QCF0_9GAMM|nr:HpcH/HpaI aldolase/citrate lyase family protein [Aidingimonas halophila]GHC20911.1 2,4-dihydroxyhept-2-ene-1,7-dioic acid aldolase [Aidingimonas halophila]SDW04841.1 2,4-dihydroxyhept-2-enedioate aldolase [Aidingimonas halophila]